MVYQYGGLLILLIEKSFFLMQKRIVRIISGAKYNDHTDPLFNKLQILKLDDIYRLHVSKLVLKQKQNALPLPLRSLFIWNSDIQQRRTRQHDDLRKCRTTKPSEMSDNRCHPTHILQRSASLERPIV
jgi:hypothetical protein